MTKPDSTVTRPGGTTGADAAASPCAAAREARAERLAAALKTNLRRRKAQARERAAEGPDRTAGSAQDNETPATIGTSDKAHDSAGVIADKRRV